MQLIVITIIATRFSKYSRISKLSTDFPILITREQFQLNQLNLSYYGGASYFVRLLIIKSRFIAELVKKFGF